MGHRDIATTQRYTYLRSVHEIPAHERLADAVPIADSVTVSRKRGIRKEPRPMAVGPSTAP